VGELETIARFRDLPAAQLAQGMLEAAGIPAFLADEYFVGVNWQLSYAIGGSDCRCRTNTLKKHEIF
jgi:hypothetical protein